MFPKQSIGSSSPVSDGLARDFLARHSQDRSIQQSLNRDDRGLIGASEAYSERSYFGATVASSYERLDGAFSDNKKKIIVPAQRSRVSHRSSALRSY